ncbi:HpcH/HpaI aldolase/citrate lyase family protein [Acinetobacter guillouiae]|jgi:citrate lyase beta subunit|uniref:HpcH/HpaI aldolase/citrate lyase family protein n=1 Tax=Acinetobacter guillouiae TaxID=106649 RepID=A0A8X8GHK4_ACIGI|nr:MULTISPECIES: HpcH/HpaI aldolase/citrate lyase family protein [Acinetobacter]MBK5647837.1 HpcH/HpaI aldolase/citrate lyase family protein [Acinetobacter sp.]KQX03530.1 citrate lyase beta chain [Acinetobacter sp. Root1280]MCF0265248.1 HpcH/HpaI aldolase/citrate lyase family protein [Acinetobacter guillouiae]MCS4296802.1 citrate lyase beta subunit [Acinetobacter guillouiae]MCU4491422.1 HpcH/HpaI aldolase/citrate lyase family protein [Acinetobacter guillouiae]
MKPLLHAIELGATMYIPATHEQLWEVTQGIKFPQIKSIAVCLEDAVLESDVQTAMVNLKLLLQRRLDEPSLKAPAIFIRPRNMEMAKHIVDWDLNQTFNGMILPKFNVFNLKNWMNVLPANLQYMPTLETKEIFDVAHNIELYQALKYDFHKTLCLRIGGNDLLSCLNLRRPKNTTIYQTPVGILISQLAGLFIPNGFQLSSPVCEHFENTQLLMQELEQDMNNGIYTKTAIHPAQIGHIHHALQVQPEDFHEAQLILAHDAKSVFKSHGSMIEPATHKNWAEMILLRYKTFGLVKSSCSTHDKILVV